MEVIRNLVPFIVCGLFGFWIGWVGGKAQGRDDERARAATRASVNPTPGDGYDARAAWARRYEDRSL